MSILKYTSALFISLSAMPGHDTATEQRAFRYTMDDNGNFISNEDITPPTYVFSAEFIANAISNLKSEYNKSSKELFTLLEQIHQNSKDKFCLADIKLLNRLTQSLSATTKKMNYLSRFQENTKLNPDSLYHFDFYNHDYGKLMQNYELMKEYVYHNMSIRLLLNKTLPSFVICLTTDFEKYFIAGSSIGNSFDEFNNNSLFSMLHPFFVEKIKVEGDIVPAIKMRSQNTEFEILMFCHKDQLQFYQTQTFDMTIFPRIHVINVFKFAKNEEMMNLIKVGLQERMTDLFS